MKVLTLNCLYPQYARSSGLPAKSWGARETLIVDIIKKAQADVAGLQEVAVADAAAIAKRLGWEVCASGLNAVIWNAAKLTGKTRKAVQLTGPDDRRVVVVEFYEGLTVASTHLSHKNSIPGKSEARAKAYRLAQAQQVASVTKAVAGGVVSAAICADLNSTTRVTPGFPRPALAKAGFIQLRKLVAVKNGDYNTSTALKAPVKRGEWLDEIAIRNGKVVSGELLLVGQASDHNALVADVKMGVPATISKGARGRTVKALQSALRVGADGIFGPNTEAAVKALQGRMKLTTDGIVGPMTWAKIPSVRY